MTSVGGADPMIRIPNCSYTNYDLMEVFNLPPEPSEQTVCACVCACVRAVRVSVHVHAYMCERENGMGRKK